MGHMGVEVVDLEPGHLQAKMDIREVHMAGNSYVHAASIISLADTSCGFGCYAHLPPHAKGFTTIELKCNHMGTAKVGQTVVCDARLMHAGKSTQVWDAVVSEGGKVIALFRCTEIILTAQG